MKKILIIAAVALVSSCLLFAVDQGPAKVAPGKWGKGENIKQPGIGLGMYERLNLTEEQKTKIQEIFKNARDQMQAIWETAQQQANEILTPEQKQRLEEMKEKMREEIKERREKMEKEKEGNKPKQ